MLLTWDLLSSCADAGTAKDDDKAPIPDAASLLEMSLGPLSASCHWDLSSACAHVGTVNDKTKASNPCPCITARISRKLHAIGISLQHELNASRRV